MKKRLQSSRTSSTSLFELPKVHGKEGKREEFHVNFLCFMMLISSLPWLARQNKSSPNRLSQSEFHRRTQIGGVMYTDDVNQQTPLKHAETVMMRKKWSTMLHPAITDARKHESGGSCGGRFERLWRTECRAMAKESYSFLCGELDSQSTFLVLFIKLSKFSKLGKLKPFPYQTGT